MSPLNARKVWFLFSAISHTSRSGGIEAATISNAAGSQEPRTWIGTLNDCRTVAVMVSVMVMTGVAVTRVSELIDAGKVEVGERITAGLGLSVAEGKGDEVGIRVGVRIGTGVAEGESVIEKQATHNNKVIAKTIIFFNIVLNSGLFNSK